MTERKIIVLGDDGKSHIALPVGDTPAGVVTELPVGSTAQRGIVKLSDQYDKANPDPNSALSDKGANNLKSYVDEHSVSHRRTGEFPAAFANNQKSIASGPGARAGTSTDADSLAHGIGATSGDGGLALGNKSTANLGMAIGHNALSSHDSIALGNDTSTSKDAQLSLPRKYKSEFGNITKGYWYDSVSIGNYIIVTDGRRIARTTDDGDTWEYIQLQSGSYKKLIVVGKSLFMMGGTSPITYGIISTDYGVTWKTVSIPSGEYNDGISDGTNIVLHNNNLNNADVAYSTDGGTTWKKADVTTRSRTYHAIHKGVFILFGGSSDSSYEISSDGGKTWRIKNAVSSFLTNTFETKNGLYLLTYTNTVSVSKDKGETFTRVNVPASVSSYGYRYPVVMGDVVILFEDGNSSNYIRSEDAGVTWKQHTKPVGYFSQLVEKNGIVYAYAKGIFLVSLDKGITWKTVTIEDPSQQSKKIVASDHNCLVFSYEDTTQFIRLAYQNTSISNVEPAADDYEAVPLIQLKEIAAQLGYELVNIGEDVNVIGTDVTNIKGQLGNFVPKTTKVNNKALDGDIILSVNDINGAVNKYKNLSDVDKAESQKNLGVFPVQGKIPKGTNILNTDFSMGIYYQDDYAEAITTNGYPLKAGKGRLFVYKNETNKSMKMYLGDNNTFWVSTGYGWLEFHTNTSSPEFQNQIKITTEATEPITISRTNKLPSVIRGKYLSKSWELGFIWDRNGQSQSAWDLIPSFMANHASGYPSCGVVLDPITQIVEIRTHKDKENVASSKIQFLPDGKITGTGGDVLRPSDFKFSKNSIGSGLLDSSGYQYINKGLLLQWFRVEVTNETLVYDLPIEYTDNVYNIIPTVIYSGRMDKKPAPVISVHAPQNTRGRIHITAQVDDPTLSYGVNVLVIGK